MKRKANCATVQAYLQAQTSWPSSPMFSCVQQMSLREPSVLIRDLWAQFVPWRVHQLNRFGLLSSVLVRITIQRSPQNLPPSQTPIPSQTASSKDQLQDSCMQDLMSLSPPLPKIHQNLPFAFLTVFACKGRCPGLPRDSCWVACYNEPQSHCA